MRWQPAFSPRFGSPDRRDRQGGDGSAFAELVHRNYARAQRLACLVARNHAVAEDELGSSFYQAFTPLSQFESTGSFSS
jgi:DNA-directed RNA polymerase specialized sigma24 family protein